MAAPAMTGDRSPKAASGIPSTLNKNAKNRFWRIFESVARERSTAAATAARSLRSKRHVRRRQRAAGAGAHREGNVGLRKRGRIVDAVADHADDATLFLHRDDRVALVLRRLPGAPFADARASCDRGRRCRMVAGQHRHARPPLPGARRPRPPRPGATHRRGSANPMTASRLRQRRRSCARQTRRAPTPRDRPPLRTRRGTRENPGERSPPSSPLTPRPACTRTLRIGSGFIASASARLTIARARADAPRPARDSSRARATRAPCDFVGRMHAGEAGRAHRQRAGLVDDERVDPLGALERRGILDQDARLRAEPHADHQRRRRRETQRAWAGDHQHRGRAHQGRRPVAGKQTVRDEGHARRWRAPPARIAPTRGRRAAGPAPSILAPRPPAGRSPPAASTPRPQWPAAQRTGFVDGSGQHDVAGAFRDRLALARQHRLVHRRFACRAPGHPPRRCRRRER